MADEPGIIADLWTHRQTAAFLKVTPGTLYVWRSKGAGPRSYKIGGSRRYDPRDVQAFVRQQLERVPGSGSPAQADGARQPVSAVPAQRA